MSDIDTGVVDSLKVLDPRRPIREADIIRVSLLMLGNGAPQIAKPRLLSAGRRNRGPGSAVPLQRLDS